MAIGDSTDFLSRLRAALPAGWFDTPAALVDAITSGMASAYAWAYSMLQYVVSQTHIATASGAWLDIIAADFFGSGLPRMTNELDTQYRARIRAALFVEKGTRAAIYYTLLRLTGRAPWIFEPARPADTGAYGGGEAVSAVGTPTVYKNDWQGNQLQYTTARTNSCLYSEQIDNAAWSKTSVTITANAVAVPNGTQTADTVVASAVSASKWAIQGFSGLPDNTNYVWSVYLKAAGYGYAGLMWSNKANTGTRLTVNLTTGAIVGTYGAAPPTVYGSQNMGNGWWRVWMVVNTSTGANPVNAFFNPFTSAGDPSAAYTGDGVSGVYAWGAQLEAGSTASSYIQTTSAAATVTDYAISGGGLVTFASAPASGATLTWTGTEYSALLGQNIAVIVATFGGGDGITKAFQLRRYYFNAMGYGLAGRYGSMQMAYQALVRAYLPTSAGIPYVAAYAPGTALPLAALPAGDSYGAYRTPARFEYASIATAQQNAALSAIYQAVDSTRAAGTLVWVATSS